ncbi:MAG: YqeG family HAD IIIA-type phosphatase [Fimbriimonas sp.]|nr:YqeG family HAD IIIA-type phosphatase [Fimbriimonas sp.]
MREWQSGRFDRQRIGRVYHRFTPAHAAESLHAIDLSELWQRGKRLLMLDVDNTLVQWHAHECSDAVVEWAREAKRIGFDICIISNTNQLERLAKIAGSIGAETVRGRFKPSRSMYRLALVKFKRKPEEAIMVGDQLMTDVLGANRTGIEAIWVRRLEGKEFKGTSINRMMERMLTGAIYQALVTPVDETPSSPDEEREKPVAQKTIVHQIIKFAIVGGTSFCLDYAITYVLMNVIPGGHGLMSQRLGSGLIRHFPGLFNWAKGPAEAAAPILGWVAAFIAMTNAFFWNRHWTFEVRGKEERAAQMRRYYFIAIMGQLINVGIFSALFNIIGNHSLAIPKIAGAAVGAVWNFLGQRFYAFRSRG